MFDRLMDKRDFFFALSLGAYMATLQSFGVISDGWKAYTVAFMGPAVLFVLFTLHGVNGDD